MPAQTTRRSVKGRIKSSTVAIYASVFVLLVAIIAVGYRAPQEQASASTTAVANTTPAADQPAVNAVVATSVAAIAAQSANLAIAPDVSELAVATNVKSLYDSTSSDTSEIDKPAIVQLSTASRSITQYAVQDGDTVTSVAAKFGLSADTIKWANNLTKDTIAAGSTLNILPVNGITYTVKDGDTVDSIASKYQADATSITTYNDLEITGLSTGLQIIIPGGVLPNTERPGYVAPRPTYNYITGYSAGFGGGKTWNIGRGIGQYGKYGYGQCTSYAAWRRAQMGIPINDAGGSWGNASAWALSAQRVGYKVDHTPAVGAIMQNGGGAGHVAIVEAILPNGDVQVSEMNAYVAGGGYNVISGRVVSAAVAGQYAYIH